MTPMNYLRLYTELEVPQVKDDQVTGWQTVALEKYVLLLGENKWDAAHPNNAAAHDALLRKLTEHFAKKDATLTVHFKDTDGSVVHAKFTKWPDLWYYAKKALLGKCSPQEAAITLQLAARFNIAKEAELQTYCDTYLGLDCNGFVGNYLVHGRGGNWDAEPPGTDFLANKTIRVIIAKGQRVTTIDDIVPVRSYIFAMVNGNGQVIAGGPDGGIGHILITEPGVMYPRDYVDENKKAWTDVPTLWGAESTGGIGLIFKECLILDVRHGIFTVKRMSHPLLPAYQFQAFRV